MDLKELLALLAVAFVVAFVFREITERLGQPGVVGEILAGVLLGPAVLGLVPAHDQAFEVLAELGIIFLLFVVGLETDVSELREVGGTATLVALGGVAIPFLLGGGLMLALGYSAINSAFVGTALVATSVGITARVLREKGKLATREARIILGAAVVDDILTLLLLAAITAFAAGTFSGGSLAALAVGALAFILVIGTLGVRVVRRMFPQLRRLRIGEPELGVTIALALAIAASAANLGLAPLVGAFLAGVILREVGPEHELEAKTAPLAAFFVPFFFIHVGSLVEVDTFREPAQIALVVGVTALAFLGKFVGGGLGALKLGRRSATIVGVGMIPRGEVGIIVASLGLGLGVITTELYAVVVAMSILTSVFAPPLLSALYRREPSEPPFPDG